MKQEQHFSTRLFQIARNKGTLVLIQAIKVYHKDMEKITKIILATAI